MSLRDPAERDDEEVAVDPKHPYTSPNQASGSSGSSGSSKIRHQESQYGAIPMASDEPPAVPVVETGLPGVSSKKITAIGEKKRHEEEWTRTPNTTGTGAIHVKTFHSKLTDDALRYMDRSINEWLDAHPQYEVKFVNSAVGVLTGKLKEPHLICQVWV